MALESCDQGTVGAIAALLHDQLGLSSGRIDLPASASALIGGDGHHPDGRAGRPDPPGVTTRLGGRRLGGRHLGRRHGAGRRDRHVLVDAYRAHRARPGLQLPVVPDIAVTTLLIGLSLLVLAAAAVGAANPRGWPCYPGVLSACRGVCLRHWCRAVLWGASSLHGAGLVVVVAGRVGGGLFFGIRVEADPDRFFRAGLLFVG